MNAIQSKQRIDFYINLTATARFLYAEYNSAVNDVINEFKNQQIGDELGRDPRNFDWIQQIKDNLYTLIKTATPSVGAPTSVTGKYYSYGVSVFTNPTDYDSFISLQTTVSGVTTYARPTNYNLIGPLVEDSYRRPSNDKPYFYENATGMSLLRGTSGTMTCTLTYLKVPATFSIGAESNTITTGGTLTNAITYYALEVSVYAGTTYQIGSTITGNGSTLTSGLVTPTSVTTAIDLPEKVQERICKMAAEKMLRSIGEFDAANNIQFEADKN